MLPLYEEIYQTVMQIPYGKVATYGQIAALIGRPKNARQIGYALAVLDNDTRTVGEEVPWHRVINSRGEVSRRAHPDFEDYQRILLEDEGVEFGLQGRVRLSVYQWQLD